MGFLITLFIAALLGLIPAAIASRKGRSFGLWWLYGTLLFIVALIHSLVIRSATSVEPVETEEPWPTCPSCGKRVDVDAPFCRHCGVELRKPGT